MKTFTLRIGTTFGAKYFDRFDQDEKIQKQPVSKMELSLQKLVHNRVDAVIASESSGIKKMLNMGIQDKIEMAAYYYSKKSRLHRYLKKISAHGESKDGRGQTGPGHPGGRG